MALGDVFESVFEGNIGTGLAVGLGVAVLGPLLRPMVTNVVRPAAKMAIRGGIYAYDSAREAMVQAREVAGDAVAEARDDMRRDDMRTDAAAADPATHRSGKRRAHDAEPAPTPAVA